MSRRTAACVAWSAWLAAAISGLVDLALGDSSWLEGHLGGYITVLSYTTVGALVATWRPTNPIGWMFCAVGLGQFLPAAIHFAAHALDARPGGLPEGQALAWIAWLARLGERVAFSLLFTFTLLLFPDGRLPSRRWRPVAWLSAAAIVAGAGLQAVQPGPFFRDLPGLTNPLGIVGESSLLLEGWVHEGLHFVQPVLGLGLPLVAASSLVVRFRRAKGVERQQLKWVAFAPVAGTVLWVSIGAIGSAVGTPEARAIRHELSSLPLMSLPLAVGIAILKHRLYDIDIVIKRTLVYGALSVVLAATYFLGLIFLQGLFAPLTQGSQLSVAGSTLVVAGVFQPARGRIQSAIDRLFYRRKYDAQRTLDAFSARLRNEVDLETLRNGLGAAVRETIHPAHVSLWLRPVALRAVPASSQPQPTQESVPA